MRQLGRLEAVVMQRLWAASGPVAVREVLEDLQQERTIAYTTVMTVLDNLHGKGLVRREKDGRAYRYSAMLTREEHTAGLLVARVRRLTTEPRGGLGIAHSAAVGLATTLLLFAPVGLALIPAIEASTQDCCEANL